MEQRRHVGWRQLRRPLDPGRLSLRSKRINNDGPLRLRMVVKHSLGGSTLCTSTLHQPEAL